MADNFDHGPKQELSISENVFSFYDPSKLVNKNCTCISSGIFFSFEVLFQGEKKIEIAKAVYIPVSYLITLLH